eukprot:jgi/Bigna1/85117/estExt_fgenesh1_pg.C_20218
MASYGLIRVGFPIGLDKDIFRLRQLILVVAGTRSDREGTLLERSRKHVGMALNAAGGGQPNPPPAPHLRLYVLMYWCGYEQANVAMDVAGVVWVESVHAAENYDSGVVLTLGWALLAIGVVFSVAFTIFLSSLYIFGSPCVREEGPLGPAKQYGEDNKHRGQTRALANGKSKYILNEPFKADVLRLNSVDKKEGGPPLGSIAMAIAPGRKRGRHQRDLQEDLKRIKSSLNIDMVVTLLTHHEMQVMECADMGVRLERLGMRWIHFPIRDKWVPLPGQTKAFLNDLIVPIAESLCEGKRILVHCNGGKGRTGTVVAATLASNIVRAHTKWPDEEHGGTVAAESLGCLSGTFLKDAIARMRKARPGMVDESSGRFRNDRE